MAGAEDQMSIVVTIIDLLKSGNSTIVLLLVLIALCAYFGWERFQMQKQLNEKIIALVNYVKAGCPKASEEEAKMLHLQLDHMQHYQLELLNRLSLYKELKNE